MPNFVSIGSLCCPWGRKIPNFAVFSTSSWLPICSVIILLKQSWTRVHNYKAFYIQWYQNHFHIPKPSFAEKQKGVRFFDPPCRFMHPDVENFVKVLAKFLLCTALWSVSAFTCIHVGYRLSVTNDVYFLVLGFFVCQMQFWQTI